jgi:flavorubredoxin
VPGVSKEYRVAKDTPVSISEVAGGIYRISGFVKEFGITFNQSLIDDEKPTLIHTGPIGMYERVREKVQEVIPLDKLSYVAFLHFESDEWGGMKFLEAPRVKLLCSDLSSKLNLVGWDNGSIDHISFWDNETLKTGKRTLRFIMTPHVHHWDSMMIFEDTTKSLFPSDLFIQPGKNKPVLADDLSESMIKIYKGAGIFASETPVRQTISRLTGLEPEMVFPMHGSCIEKDMFPKYVDALMKNEFAYSGILLGQTLESS